MIELKHLNKTFPSSSGPIEALKDISLTIEDGAVYGIIGFSGAGKSTLVRCINLLETPDSGEVLIGGTDLRTLKPAALRQARKKIGMIFQHFNLMPSRTIAENVAYPLAGSSLSKTQKKQKVQQLLDLVELSDKADAWPHQLSGGQKQRAAIARALANDPQILLCDEATSALDPMTTRSILRLLRKIQKQTNLTLVVITHQMDVVKEICTHAAVMENGRCVEQGQTADIFASPKEEVTSRFLHSTTNLKKIDSLLADSPERIALKPGQVLCRFTFGRQNATEPYLAGLALKYGLLVNIVYADIEYIQNSPIGGTVAVLESAEEFNPAGSCNVSRTDPTDCEENISRALNWLTEQGIRVEVLAHA